MPSTVFIVTRVCALIYEYSWLSSNCIIGKTAKTMLRYSAHGVRGAGAGDQRDVRMYKVFFLSQNSAYFMIRLITHFMYRDGCFCLNYVNPD